MIDTKEVRVKLADPVKWADQKRIKDYLGWSSVTLQDLCAELDALRKPVEGIERPEFLSYPLIHYGGMMVDTDSFVPYIIALEAENARLRAALRAANDPTHGHPDETDDRALDAGLRAET